MFSFQKKDIIPANTVGEKLKNKRFEKGIELEDASEELQISETYLKAIENGNFDELPSEVYVKNFLQSYCIFLKLDFNQVFQEYEREKSIHQMVKKASIEAFARKPEKKAKRWYSFLTFNLLKNLVLTLLVIACVGFLGFKINNIVAPPFLVISSPQNNIVIKEDNIEIIGQTEIGTTININGQDIILDPEGGFKGSLNLQSGLNIIKISAKKKYSKEVVDYREIMVER